MRDWIIVVVLYVVGIGFFRILGGLGAAASVFQRWGKAASSIRSSASSS